MAKIETTFIRPKELYTPETGETKVIYDGYQNNPHELVVEENLEGEVSEIVNDTFVPNEGGNVVFTDNNETEHELITEDGFAGALDTAMPTALAKAQVIETTWQELKDKRDNGQLIAGSLYRITDYNCTTTQENTRSAGHQFDIVLLALSENKLAEEGWAMMHNNIYDVAFADGVTKKCYLYKTADTNDGPLVNVVDTDTKLGINDLTDDEIIINETDKTATITNVAGYESTDLTEENLPYNYFQNSNLSAWKVWYCLDNDKSKFAWADNNKAFNMSYEDEDYQMVRDTSNDVQGLYAWSNDDIGTLYTNNETPQIGDNLYWQDGTLAEENKLTKGIYFTGKGVIYRLIDEFNNDIKYDFKNIQFKRKLTNGQYDATNGTDTWCYTLNIWYNAMCQDASIVGNTLTDDEYKISGVRCNSFGCTIFDYPIEEPNIFTFALNDNVILSIIEDSYYYGIYDNNFGEFFNNNTIGSGCDSNIIGNHSNGNIIRNGFRNNSIGNYFISNSIGDGFEGNVIGGSFNSNNINGAFMGNFVANSFEDITISSDTRGKNYGNNGVELATKS